jgi:GNAT superfamily N-acetyltransferase
MQIRECTYSDIPALIEISTRSYHQHYTHLWHDAGENYIYSNFSYEKIETEMSDLNAVFFLIFNGERPVGLLKLNVDKGINDYSPEQSLELERIYFVKESAGRGLGTKAIDFVTGFARQRNKRAIWLKTMDGSQALEFYKKQRFDVVGETELNYPGVRDEFKKMIILCKEIE